MSSPTPSQPSYFWPPTSSICTTPHTSASSSAPPLLTPPSPPPARLFRLFLAARDLPEPDARSRSAYAVVYHAADLPAVAAAAAAAVAPHGSSHVSARTHPSLSAVSDASALDASSASSPRPANTSPPATRPPTTRLAPSWSSSPSWPSWPSSPLSPSSPPRRDVNTSMARAAETRADPWQAGSREGGDRAVAPLSAPPATAGSLHRAHSLGASVEGGGDAGRRRRVSEASSAGSGRLRRRASSRLLRRDVQQTSRLRAPGEAARAAVAPSEAHGYVGADGARRVRGAWEELGRTEVARKCGRDAEFAREFRFWYAEGARQVVRVAVFDGTPRKAERQRMVGAAEFEMAVAVAVAGRGGRPVRVPLRFVAVSEKDAKRRRRIRQGELVVVAEEIGGGRELEKIRFDVECGRIVRPKGLSTGLVKRAFYTIHAVLDEDDDSDHWTLLCRTRSVEMIRRKRDGGSLQYNYFTGRRVLAASGIMLEDADERARSSTPEAQAARGENLLSARATSAPGAQMARRVRQAVGRGGQKRDPFFSLPGADVQVGRAATRLRLSLCEDLGGGGGGFDVVAYADLSVQALRAGGLGAAVPVCVHSGTVGKAVVKYVECGPQPRYFCLALAVHGLR